MYLVLKGNFRLYCDTREEAMRKAKDWSRNKPKIIITVYELIAETKVVEQAVFEKVNKLFDTRGKEI